jgi:hypothetical protein
MYIYSIHIGIYNICIYIYIRYIYIQTYDIYNIAQVTATSVSSASSPHDGVERVVLAGGWFVDGEDQSQVNMAMKRSPVYIKTSIHALPLEVVVFPCRDC